MKHVYTVSTGKAIKRKESGCRECPTSCQSACKTSCTVGNQVCAGAKEKDGDEPE